MPDINKANRQVCDVYFCDMTTHKPYLKFDTANTTTAGVEGDSVYAMAKGSRKIAFANPMTATMSIEAQVYPFKFFSLLTGGEIDDEGTYFDSETVAVDTDDKLVPIKLKKENFKNTDYYAYPADSFGDDEQIISLKWTEAVMKEDGKTVETPGYFSENVESGASKIKKDNKYTICGLIKKSGIKKISFRNDQLPKDYYVTMSTLDKDEDGNLTPFKIVAYKAMAQRNFELSFTSEGDPASVTATFDLMEDKDGNIVDMIEVTDEASK